MDQTMFQGMPPGARVCISPNGWIDSELFETWVTEHFLKHIPAVRPVLLLLDGHSTHVRLEVVMKCKENAIILFALPPHTTHKLQPLDRGCFKPLKEHYKIECKDFMEKNPRRVVSRFVFGKLFGAVYTKSLCPSTIINAFSKCGVFPFAPQVVLTSDDMAPSLVGNTAINISSVADVTKALKVMGIFGPSESLSRTSLSQPLVASANNDVQACPPTITTQTVEQDEDAITIMTVEQDEDAVTTQTVEQDEDAVTTPTITTQTVEHHDEGAVTTITFQSEVHEYQEETPSFVPSSLPFQSPQ
ncbi:uncharacterized protein LOC117338421 [Pecten maximus]|uniref:uncharacterized protein LOC117338421 n=1 Tax=Pecten maximus TaxID=6579 RepID=UPI001457EE4E|nr:uncharacterized protein LOC117338421 [Pecten maximus]